MARTPLTPEQSAWVEATMASLTLEEKLGHLLCPEDRNYTVEEWLDILRDVPVGSAFFAFRPAERSLACVRALQNTARIPLLIASDLENGAGCMVDGATEFPRPMAVGAAGSIRLAEAMGRATGREGRAFGIHWTFSPVVDLNMHFQNPITNVRSFGDRPVDVARLSAAMIRGIQASGRMAATAKHFPGDGTDDRDQHICTTVNRYSVPAWWKTYGRVWKAAIDAGVLSIMVGHISFPAYVGLSKCPAEALPATIDPALQTRLLREELGFEGVIVSDAAPMIGITSRVKEAEAVIRNIETGSDVFLFADPRADFARLREAAASGRLPLERVEQSVRRVLEMKARLGLYRDPFAPQLTPAERQSHADTALEIAQQAVTLARANERTPAPLPLGARVLTVTVTYDNGRPDAQRWLPEVDAQLALRGYAVEHLDNPSNDVLRKAAARAERVFCNVVIYPHAQFGTIRMTGQMMDIFWRAFYVEYPNVVFTSFGTPYLLYEQPHWPNLYLTYGHSAASQQAAVQAWLGEIPARGKLPVRFTI